MVRPGLELRSLNFKATVYHAFSSVGSESKLDVKTEVIDSSSVLQRREGLPWQARG